MNYMHSLTIGNNAPDFSCNSTMGNISLDKYKGKWLVFFSHPGDFTPVCTTEFIEFAKMHSDFNKINCELLGLSIDSNASHLAWVLNIEKNTNVKITFPIIADRDGHISTLYNMLNQGEVNKGTVRSVYIINPDGIIKAIMTYPKEVGRNIPEILRTVIALQATEQKSVMTPANWLPGMPEVIPPPSTYEEIQKNLDNSNCFDWYLCFKGGNIYE